MILLDRNKVFTNKDIATIENNILYGIMGCRTTEAVEAAITYANFLNKTGLTNENYPIFIKVLEIGNHWVIDALIGDRDPFLFFSSIQPNYEILAACFALLAERHPGAIYAKTLSVILGILQAAYNVPIDGYRLYDLSVSDVNSLGKHLDEEVGQEDSLNRVILDILDKISQLEGLEPENRNMEEVAIHANEIRNFFFDETKHLSEVIPPVLLVRMDYKKFEVAPRKLVDFKQSKLFKEDTVAGEASVKTTTRGKKVAPESPTAAAAEETKEE
ncbi:hypothetical protein WKV44_06270 [Spirochaetia bacterium 38H-sp]|uniref:Uncharacterized protein n=1 Tax=Rarispira pelagica TaxID=3141764 RepID=A0ABU9UBU6_9SPIR